MNWDCHHTNFKSPPYAGFHQRADGVWQDKPLVRACAKHLDIRAACSAMCWVKGTPGSVMQGPTPESMRTSGWNSRRATFLRSAFNTGLRHTPHEEFPSPTSPAAPAFRGFGFEFYSPSCRFI